MSEIDEGKIDSTDGVEPAKETWPRVVKLITPITFGDETIEQLSFRRGQVGDMRGIVLASEEIPANDLILLASRLCGRPTQVIERLDIEDGGEVTSIALGFYAKFVRKSGRKR